jgi:23S rRNA pseudouridine2605 synthase
MRERLQRLIAEAGIASRRHAEQLISAGQVIVNGETVTELGFKADSETDHIRVRGRLINPLLRQRKNVYVVLNKPKGYLTSMDDPQERPLVIDLIPSALGRLHSVGRLDFNTEGLLLLTNDGDFTNRITSARNGIPKVYRAKVKGIPNENAIKRLRRGLSIGRGERTAPAEVRRLRTTATNSWFEVVLHEGRNQQIRRMFDAIGHSVVKLRRTRIGTLEAAELKSGEWRKLTDAEVRRLKSVSTTKVIASLRARQDKEVHAPVVS